MSENSSVPLTALNSLLPKFSKKKKLMYGREEVNADKYGPGSACIRANRSFPRGSGRRVPGSKRRRICPRIQAKKWTSERGEVGAPRGQDPMALTTLINRLWLNPNRPSSNVSATPAGEQNHHPAGKKSQHAQRLGRRQWGPSKPRADQRGAGDARAGAPVLNCRTLLSISYSA